MYRRGLNNYQWHVEVYFRYLILKLHQKCGNIILGYFSGPYSISKS